MKTVEKVNKYNRLAIVTYYLTRYKTLKIKNVSHARTGKAKILVKNYQTVCVEDETDRILKRILGV